MPAKVSRDAFQLKILLADTHPPVWRRLQIPATLSLARLHRAIQAAFGWEDDHGHVFRIRGGEYGRSGTEEAFDLQGERISLAGLGIRQGETFHYEYDFEDSWTLVVTVEELLPLETPLRGPRCLGGRRACPPEGSGGPFAFRERLTAAQDPSHPDHGQAMAFFPTGWKADVFDLEAAREALKDL